MKTITAMRSEIDMIMTQLGEMRTKCQAEDRQPNDEEKDWARGQLRSVKELEDQIELELAYEETRGRIEKPVNDPAKPDPSEGEKRGGMPGRKQDRFASFGEQLAAVMRAGMPNGSFDPRLQQRASGMNEGINSDGGFLVQTDFTAELLKAVFDTGLLAQRCRRIQISNNSNGVKINGIDETSRVSGSRWGGVLAYWEGEAATATAKRPKFKQLELKLKKLIGLCYATEELMNDAPALQGVIQQAFVEEFGFQIDEAIFRGTGAGQPLGFTSGGGLVTVAKESGQTADTVVYANVVNMWSRLIAKCRQNAVWMVNQDVEPQLFQMAIEGSSGGVFPVYLPPGGASASPYGTLFGRPVIPIEQCATLGDKNDIVLGSFQDGYLLAEKGGVKSDVSIHVRFLYDESVFRFVIRVDGQPVLSSAITPYKGSNTQSHFVTLAARA